MPSIYVAETAEKLAAKTKRGKSWFPDFYKINIKQIPKQMNRNASKNM